MQREVSLSTEKPYPFPIRLWNFFGDLRTRSKLKEDELIQKAKSSTGLSDFGEDYFMEPFQMLVKSINEEARLHAFGSYVTKIRLVNLLSNRLRAEHYMKMHPETLDQELHPVCWIVGLQRTGTTFLQRLLADTPETAAVFSWEALNPVPLENDPRNSKRMSLARTSERGLRYIAPNFFAIHPVEHRSPEEEVLLLDISFMSTVPEATLNVPTYAEWLEKQNQAPAYQYMEKLLKILQFQKGPKKRWVLKSPHHLEHLSTLHEVFPNSRLIFTHRDPVKTIASFCSMIYFSRRIFSKEVDKKEIARHWLRKIRIMLDKSVDFRESNTEKITIDVAYEKLVKDPIPEMQKILKSCDKNFRETDQKQGQISLKRNRKNKFGAHKYELKDFGLNKEYLEKVFSRYKTKYSLYL